MKHTPKLSIILPVYNAAPYLEAAFFSLNRQTLTDFEVLCINDCSTDESLNVLSECSKNDDRFRVIDLKENIGAGKARNVGLQEAVGEYITFFDADDEIESDLYERAVLFAEKTNADEVVFGLTEEHYDKNKKKIRSFSIAPPTEVHTNEKDCMNAFLELERTTLFGYQWNCIYRGDILRKYNIRFESVLLYEDFFFNIAVAKKVNVLATLHHTGYHYFKRANQSITHRFTKDYFSLSYRRIDTFFHFLKDKQTANFFAYQVLGSRLLRYTLSALCRNTDPRAEMTFSTRKNWFLFHCDKPLFSALLPISRPKHPALRLLRRALLQKKAITALTLGKTIALLRKIST